MNRNKLDILYVLDEFPSISTPFIINQIIGAIDNGHHISIWSRTKGDTSRVHKEIERYQLLQKTIFLDKIDNAFKCRFKYFLTKGWSLFKSHPLIFLKTLNFFKYKNYALGLRLFHDTFGFIKAKRKEFDIIHAQFGPLGLMAQRLKDIHVVNGKLITHFRGYDVSKHIRYEGKSYYKYLFTKGDFFLANSIYFKNIAIKLGAPVSKIRVQYSGVQINKFSVNRYHNIKQKGDFIRIGSVGRLSGKKGYKYCLQALCILKELGYKFSYEIIGDGGLRKRITKEINELGLSNEVTLLGRRNHDEISTFLKSIDIFISHNVTSKDGDQDAPVNTLKEAMLAGSIVFSTFHGGIPELVETGINGFLTEEKNSNELAEAIIKNYFNNDSLNDLVINAQNKVKNDFCNNKLNIKLNKLYWELSSK